MQIIFMCSTYFNNEVFLLKLMNLKTAKNQNILFFSSFKKKGKNSQLYFVKINCEKFLDILRCILVLFRCENVYDPASNKSSSGKMKENCN